MSRQAFPSPGHVALTLALPQLRWADAILQQSVGAFATIYFANSTHVVDTVPSTSGYAGPILHA
jgi:hypothetical protein